MLENTGEVAICVIGGGAAGIAIARVLHERGLPFTWFEKGSRLGGLWAYENSSGKSAAYDSLTTNTSRDTMGFPGFPLRTDLPDFPSHQQVLEYLDSYVDRFDLRRLLTTGCTVIDVEKDPSGGFLVFTQQLAADPPPRFTGGYDRHWFSHVIMATGMFWEPVVPKLEGSFAGHLYHSFKHRDPATFRGKRVLVMGAGPSGADIAVEAAREADRAILSLRHGVHYLHRYGADGRPADTKNSPWLGLLPWRWRQHIMARFAKPLPGFPKPPHGILQGRPVAHVHLGRMCEEGQLITKPGVASVSGSTVRFADGTEEDVDVIVAATGYQVTTPKLSPDIKRALWDERGNIWLYLNIVPPSMPDLLFLGFVKQLGPIFPTLHYQALYIADLLQGTCQRPSQMEMEMCLISRYREGLQRYQTQFNTLLVDLHSYWLELSWARRPRGLSWWKSFVYDLQCLVDILARPAVAPHPLNRQD